MQTTVRFSHLFGAGLAAVALVACSDDSGGEIDAGPDAGDTLPVPDSGTPFTPPMPPPLSDDYTLTACPGATPPMGIEAFDVLPDCGHICGGGRCVPNSLVMGISSAAGVLPPCEDGQSLCIPLAVAMTGGNFQFQACTSILDPNMQGACVPICFAAMFAGVLGQETCGAGELCAPCVSPLDMMDTGACGFLECGPGGEDAGSDGTDSGATDDGG